MARSLSDFVVEQVEWVGLFVRRRWMHRCGRKFPCGRGFDAAPEALVGKHPVAQFHWTPQTDAETRGRYC